MRRSELAFLDKKDIDIKNNIVTIRNSKIDGRVMPIYGAMEEIFKRRCNGVGRVFPKWKPDSITHRWIRLMKRLGIKGRLHDLRHSTASYLVLAGEDIRTIQKILGHTDISTTMIYSHLTQDHMRKALSSLDKLHKNSITENLKIVIGGK